MMHKLIELEKVPETAKLSKEEQAYLEIKKNIVARKFVPGQKIIFRDLEELLGMSKTPITSALARLEQEGFLASEHNRGYYVKELNADEIKQLYQLRIRLEEIAVEFAIENHTPDDLNRLKTVLAAYLDHDCAYYDIKRLHLDIDFHMQIARMSGNKFLIESIKQIYERALIGLAPAFMTPLIPRFKQEHIQIVQAIENRDVELAKKLIRDHESVTIDVLETA